MYPNRNLLMRILHRTLEFWQRALPLLATCTLAASLHANPQGQYVLHLKDGSRINGRIVTEDSNRVVVSNAWSQALTLPRSAIEKREPAVAKATPPRPARKAKPAPKRNLKTNVKLGTDFFYGEKERQHFFGRLKLTYRQPYQSNAQDAFRSIFDYSADYGQTDGVESANRMNGSVKTDFDLGKRVFIYNLAGAGYDRMRKVDLSYEFGPGAGYHLFRFPAFVMNIESGLNHQAEERADNQDVENLYIRLAQDLTWKIMPRLTLNAAYEFFPQFDESGQFRTRADNTLSLGLTSNLSLNLTVLDLYDTSPARDVDNNELQVRSSVGVTF